ncbi:MAG: 3-hydroxyisobutyrate dehydrogenase [Gammaproteobacteria bacterium]|jgi:3-hydroxyisobutyrate dehydrogenase
MADSKLGFIGLGNMGAAMAQNLANAGADLSVFDTAGTADRAPEGAHIATSVAHVASVSDPIVLSLPDGNVVKKVIKEIVEHPGTIAHTIVDTSTIGVQAARAVHRTLLDAGFEYIDAPVSGGISGAQGASIAVMFAGSEAALKRLTPILSPMCGHLLHVGSKPGQGQAMKVLNNFLSGTAMVATSEAIAFGLTQGLDMARMLDVLNVSSGANSATRDKFPNRILTGSYDGGFAAKLMLKDVSLYLESVKGAGTPNGVAQVVYDQWLALREAEPDADFTRMFAMMSQGDDKSE